MALKAPTFRLPGQSVESSWLLQKVDSRAGNKQMCHELSSGDGSVP